MRIAVLFCLLLGTAPLAGAGADAPPLKVGDRAPDFRLQGSDGKWYTLKQFRGKSAVLLSWYPNIMTPG